MNHYQFLIPLITLLLGIFFMAGTEILGDEKSGEIPWLVHAFVLALAFFQQAMLYRMPPTLFVRGGMSLDGVTQLFSCAILILALITQLNRRDERRSLSSQINILSLGTVVFSLVAIQSNRFLFGIISLLGMIWTSQSALAAESDPRGQPALVHSAIIRGLVFLVGGVFLCLLALSTFGETQIDEIQRMIVRAHFRDEPLFALEIFITFLAAFTMGIPPFQGLFGSSRQKASWSLSIGLGGVFAVTGMSLFVRWGLVVFSRVAIGGLELEPLTNLNIFLVIRVLSSTALVLCPFLSLSNRNLRGSFLIFMLNPFIQCLFAFSFGQKETLAHGMVDILVSVFVLGMMISSAQSLNLTHDTSLQDWTGVGRRNRSGTLGLLIALAGEAGFAPFYGSLLVQKTLSINSWHVIFLLLNMALSGFYVARLVALAFHRGSALGFERGSGEPVFAPESPRKMWFALQFVLLIFIGIFWQPLYKYGAFSIRSFFGEI